MSVLNYYWKDNLNSTQQLDNNTKPIHLPIKIKRLEKLTSVSKIGITIACMGVVSMPTISLAQAPRTRAADTANTPRCNLHFQTTYIYQYQPEFSAKYSGTNSLQPKEEKQNSITATLFFGLRLWKGAELYINPEVAGGSGLSGAFGLAASTNGETFRVGSPEPTLYLARGYFAQTLRIGKRSQKTDEGYNELGGIKPTDYVRFYLGKLSLGDLFDNNLVAKDPRTQFMNWCLMSNGAWDYAANTRGYTYAFATVVQYHNMAYKAAVAMLPVTANGQDLNTHLSEEYALNAEIDRSYSIKGKSGNIRLLGYHNSGHLGNYLLATPNADIVNTRQFGRTKTGLGISADQQLTDCLNIFARAGWNDGKNETWAFTEADRTVSLGMGLNGKEWNREQDNVGCAVVANGLSPDHKNYLAAGGLGFQLGDGHLNYNYETAVELYYSYKPIKSGIWLTGDYQFIVNPGYNSERGPVNVFSLRIHVEI